MQSITITYSFELPDKKREFFVMQLDPKSLELIGNIPERPPRWTALTFHQCPNCPFDSNIHPTCPLALKLVNIVNRFDQILSYDQIKLKVITEERTISHTTTAQRALGSLIGLIFASSGCPHTAFFKPMVRFHLPLASEEETIYRASSMYLLAQYFLSKEGRNADFNLCELENIYNNINIINTSIANRLRMVSKADSSINAIILLDMYTKVIPFAICESLEEIRYLFKAYLTQK
jgi:hypothetical protein